MPAVPIGLLPRLLDEIGRVVEAESAERREELLEAVFEELLERVGDAAKAIVMRWWFDQLEGASSQLIAKGSNDAVEERK
jgi:hypothetical protein